MFVKYTNPVHPDFEGYYEYAGEGLNTVWLVCNWHEYSIKNEKLGCSTICLSSEFIELIEEPEL